MRKARWAVLCAVASGCINFQAAVDDCVDAGLCDSPGGGSGTGGGSAGSGGSGGGTAGSGGGTAGGTAGGTSSASFQVLPSSLTFAARELDAGDATQPLTVTNLGPLPLGGLTLRLSPLEASFSVDSGCPGSLVSDGGSCQLAVTFTPTHEGPANTQLFVGFADAGEQSVSLSASAFHTVNLEVDLSGAGGRIVSDDGGIDCTSPTCTRRYPAGSVVTLTPQPQPRYGVVSLTGGGCSGTAPCAVTLANDTVVVGEFDRFNVIFTTSFTLRADYSPTNSAYSACLYASQDAGLGNNFYPLNSEAGPPTMWPQLVAARGWMRPDGLPVADTFSDLIGGHFNWQPDQDEHGKPLTDFKTLTGLRPDGGYAPADCDRWRDAGMLGLNRGWVGSAAQAGSGFLEANFDYCGPGHLVCVEYGHHPVVSPRTVPAGARRVFLSQPYAANTAADARCRQEAVGLPRASAFVALRSQPDGGRAIDALSPVGGQWYRLDGVPWVSSNAQLFDGGLFARRTVSPLYIQIDGGPVLGGPAAVWTGGYPNNTPSQGIYNSCRNWTASTSADTAAYGNALSSGNDSSRYDDPFLGAAFSGQPCDSLQRLYCVEN